MQTVHVQLAERSYPIHIGPGLLDDAALIASALAQKKVAIVSNETVAPIYLERLTARLRSAGVESMPIVLPDGERYKNWETLNGIYDTLLRNRCERKTTLIALGGGVVGDITGFAAATYLRGVPYIQIPTTLLAQVDSSVGGKTAINHPLGKNMIGAFYQPRAVIADTQTLNTLPERELSAGLAEVIKYGLIRDLPFFEWLEANMEKLIARDAGALTYAIQRSCENKADVVAADERETGERALLNLGHTFGHAIETATDYTAYLHGEAVAIGTMLAADLSLRLKRIDARAVERIRALLQRARLPITPPALGAQRLRELMGSDKKVEQGQLRLILLNGIGAASVVSPAGESELSQTLRGGG